jgi:hypothetical protein
MEQLTPTEWLREQLRRAPSFAISTAIVAGLLLVTNWIQWSEARTRPDQITVEVDIADDDRDRDDDWQIERDPPIRKPFEPVKPPKLEVEPKATDVAQEVEVPPIVEIDRPTEPVLVEPLQAPGFGDFPPDRSVTKIGTGPGRPTGGTNSIDFIRGEPSKRKARRDGMPPRTLGAIHWGLKWLQKAQNSKTGGWECRKWGGSRSSNVGVSGLATLSFLGNGCSDRHKTFGRTVRQGVEYLIAQQRTEGRERGSFGERMYAQAICTMALTEASQMLVNKRLAARARVAAQMGIDYILERQPLHGGFTYNGPGNDTSVTGWQIMAIKAAKAAKLDLQTGTMGKVQNFLDRCLSSDFGSPYRFNPAGRTSGGTPRMTAVSLASRLFMGHRPTAKDCKGQAKWLASKGHLNIAKQGGDYYFIYYASLAMFQMGGKYWDDWNNMFNIALRKRQEKSGTEKGSWPIDGSAYGRHGGRVYTTSMACLSLEVYFRFLRMYRRA